MLGEERETERNFLSQFIGLAFRDKRNPAKEKKGGKCIEQRREIRKKKREEKGPILLSTEWSALWGEIY